MNLELFYFLASYYVESPPPQIDTRSGTNYTELRKNRIRNEVDNKQVYSFFEEPHILERTSFANQHRVSPFPHTKSILVNE